MSWIESTVIASAYASGAPEAYVAKRMGNAFDKVAEAETIPMTISENAIHLGNTSAKQSQN